MSDVKFLPFDTEATSDEDLIANYKNNLSNHDDCKIRCARSEITLKYYFYNIHKTKKMLKAQKLTIFKMQEMTLELVLLLLLTENTSAMLSTLGKTTTRGLTTFDFHLVWRQYLYIILYVGKISLNSSRKDKKEL